MNKHYYRFMGYYDGSGNPYGIVIKCYTEEQALHLISIGHVLYQLDNYLK